MAEKFYAVKVGKIALKVVKVKGHSCVEGNEEADRLAKEAVCIG